MSKTRHILGVSGGKDSAALAIYLRDMVPDMEYVFCDTATELPETYDFIEKLEVFLNKHIVRLPAELPGYSNKLDFDHYLDLYGGYLPSAAQRWCTKKLKLDPFEKYFGDDKVINYVGIRADENRLGYLSTSDQVETIFPFVDDNIDKNGVMRILNESGVGYPDYYKWRSRSGCYFCFYQRKEEWVGLKENHPALFEKAKKYEQGDFKWRQDMKLSDLDDPKVVQKIKDAAEKEIEGKRKLRPGATLLEVLDEVRDADDVEKPCLICHL